MFFKVLIKNAIRFIVLQPDKDINARVQCLWIHTTLTECNDDVVEHYRVLAYVWGDPRITTPISSISVDGCDIELTVDPGVSSASHEGPLKNEEGRD
ncbi:hypothetical protein BGZ57DRAFT_922612 [Hyaloscypha finlandica]|nr:hypothetical protein BGZ57DRAFT_922612 [Hyaloscypha finlandica]